jgi:hypothetical protein
MIYVAGCHHDIQSRDPVPFFVDSAAVNRQREQFVQLVEWMLTDEKVELMAEEWGRTSESVAQALAKKHMVRYVDINTSFQDLDTLQIPHDYRDLSKCTVDQWQACLRHREMFMLEKIRSPRGTANTVLVICGFDHLEPLAKQLRDDERVIQIEYRNENWYLVAVPS